MKIQKSKKQNMLANLIFIINWVVKVQSSVTKNTLVLPLLSKYQINISAVRIRNKSVTKGGPGGPAVLVNWSVL